MIWNERRPLDANLPENAQLEYQSQGWEFRVEADNDIQQINDGFRSIIDSKAHLVKMPQRSQWSLDDYYHHLMSIEAFHWRHFTDWRRSFESMVYISQYFTSSKYNPPISNWRSGGLGVFLPTWEASELSVTELRHY